jgi:hypothetical protein
VNPSDMPQHKPCRIVQGRYTVLVRKWSDGKWKHEGVRNDEQAH